MTTRGKIRANEEWAFSAESSLSKTLLAGFGFVGFGSCPKTNRSAVKSSYIVLSDIAMYDGSFDEKVAVVILSNSLRRSSALAVSEKIFAIADELGVLPETVEAGVAISEGALAGAGFCVGDLARAGALIVYDMSAESGVVGSGAGAGKGASGECGVDDRGAGGAGGAVALFAPGAFFIRGIRAGVNPSFPVFLRYGYCEAFDLYCEAAECSRMFYGQLFSELSVLAQKAQLQGKYSREQMNSVLIGVLKGLTFGRFDSLFSDNDLEMMLSENGGMPFGVVHRENLEASYMAQRIVDELKPSIFQTERIDAAREMAFDFQKGYYFLGASLSKENPKLSSAPKMVAFFSELLAFVEERDGTNFGVSEVTSYVEELGERTGLKELHAAYVQGVDWEDLEGVF